MTDRRDKWRAIRQTFEEPLVRFGALFTAKLPRSVIVRLARCLGTITYWTSPGMRKVGRANLDIAFGSTRTPQEKNRILRKSLENFSLVLLDLFWFSLQSKERMLQYVNFGDKADAFFCHRAQICVTGHMGNWELIGRAVSSMGYPLASVALPLKNPVVDALLNQARESTGQVIIPRQGAVKSMLQILRKAGKVALLLDHNTLPSEGGVFLDFFGLPAAISASAEALAFRTQAEIAFGFCVPCGGGAYQTHVLATLEPSTYGDGMGRDLALTKKIVALYEDAIRRFPEYWLWTYKRWKYIKPGDDPSRYPFYAKPLKEHQR